MNGGKDIRLGHDKRQVSIVPNSEQNLYNFVTGEKLTDQFGIPVIAEVDTYYLADATAKRSSSIVFDGTKNPYTKQNYQTIGICSALYGDYDVYLSQPFTVLQSGGGTVSVSSTVLTSSGYVILGDFPYQEVNTSVDQGSEKNKLYFNTSVGISTILGVSVGDFVSGPDIPDGTYVTKVSYNSRLTLSNNTTNSLGQSKDILIQRKNIFTAKADPVWKIAEQFKETSEVSTTLLGINRAETQLALFANVSSYGLDPDDFETYSYNDGNSFGSWETRKNAIYGNRYTATITEETQESAIKLTAFPTPYSYPYGPKFEKLGLYNKVLFDKYIDFIEWGNALYDYFDTGAGSSYPAGWKDNFLSSEFAYSNGSDIVYPVGFADGFAQIDTWTDTWRKLGSQNLIDPTNGSIFDGSVVNGYTKSSTQPGYSDRNRRYAYLQSKKVFRYQPGRISGFTFGLRSSVEPVPGITLEWGIANNTDQYIFQIDEGNFSIVRRSTVPLDLSVLKRNGLVLSDQPNIPSGDPFDTELYYTIKIPTDNFNGDVLNGNGPSGYKLKPENVTMYKIEFGWYGAIGARFYAYIPTDNGDARWVVIHTLVIENSLDAPCLRDSYFRFKYSLNISNTGNVETPQYLYKYGASYYIDGGDEGTSQIYSAPSKQKTIKTTHSKSLIGIFPKEYLLNREGEEIKNKKLIIPESLNVSTDSLTEVKVVTCSACPGFGHVYTPGVATTENGRYIDAAFDTKSSIVTVGSGVYFTESDVGAKIIAPSIYNAYIVGLSGQVSGTDNYTKAELKRFGGTSGFQLETNPIGGELVFDRVLGITTTIDTANNQGIGGTYPHQIRLSNYDATAASNFAFTGSKIEIQFVNPNNGDDYAHFADFLIGVTNKEPIVDIDTLDGFILPGIGNTTILSNSQILYGEHTHSYAASNEDGVEISESWASLQPPLRMGIDYRIPGIASTAGGICSKLTVDVLDPLEIRNVNQRDYLPGTTIQDGRTWIEVAGVFDPTDTIDFAGGQIVIRNATNSNVGIVENGLVMNLDAGNTKSYPAKNFVSSKIYSSFSSSIRSSNYTVQYSDDNSNWTTAFTGVASNNTSCGIQQNTGSGSGSYGLHRYWRYVEGSPIQSHHPRVSRIILTDINGIDYNLVVYTSDNCSDTGTYQVGTVSLDFGGTTWTDLSGNGNTGTLTNGPTYSSANGGSIVFDGIDDKVSTNYKPSGARSYFIWVKYNSLTHSSGYQLSGTQEVNAYTYIGIENGGGVYYYAGDNTGGNVGNPVTVNTWVNLGFVLNADGSRIVYKDGVNIHSNSGGLGVTATAEFSVGCVNNNHNVNGNISNVTIYNRALSATEVAQNYNSIAGRYGLPLVATTVSIPTTENVTITNSKFVGVTSSYKDSQNKQFSYIEISPPLSSTVGSNFTILIRPVSITGTTIYKQKLYNYNPWPLYLVAKLKDNAAINNITVKETIGDFQRSISPKWYVSNNCTVTTAGGNADPTGAAPTNFQEIDRSSSALIDIQNEQKLRPYVEKDTLYIGAYSTETINMRKVFGPDRSVITPDNNNIEATFIIAKKIVGAGTTGITGTVEASINFKEQ